MRPVHCENELTSYAIPPTMFYYVYVDDIQIGFKSCNLSSCEEQAQLGLNKALKWANENGFKIKPLKILCVLFHRKRGLVLYP